MKTILKSVLAGAAMLSISLPVAAHADGTMPAFPFAATGFLSGGGSWMDCDNCGDYDLATIVGGGDFVIPVTGYWNIQLGGAWRYDRYSFEDVGYSIVQFQGGGIGFWRDSGLGLFGIEAGVFTPSGNDAVGVSSGQEYVKLGGVVEYYFSDSLTIGGFGGVLLPIDPNEFISGNNTYKLEEGFYAGGQLTYYASDQFALSGFAEYLELNASREPRDEDTSAIEAFRAGGKVRYLTSFSGVELFVSGAYSSCDFVSTFAGGGGRTRAWDGAEVMGGVTFHIGGRGDSLVNIDRSNSINTRAWSCDS